MKNAVKLIAVLIVAILLISSIYVVFFSINEEKPSDDESDDTNDDEPDDDNNKPDGSKDNETDDGNGDQTIQNYAFIEEATFTTCEYCVDVSKIIHELYESKDYPVYYVSMIRENEIAKKRLEDEYNIVAYPTVFIDGGYNVVYGKKDKSVYQTRINDALKRDKPEILVNVTAEYEENASEISIKGYAQNLDTEEYNGLLRVYLTEIISTKWRDNTGNAYHFAFLDFPIDKDISVSLNKTYEFSIEIDSSDLDAENLKIFAVVFSSKSVEKYSDPKEDGGNDENSFNAYYVDGVASADVVEGGNTPPAVGISIPQQGMFYFRGNPVFGSKLRNTFIFGKTTVTAVAEDDGEIVKVEFYIDDELVKTDERSPYKYSFNKIGLFRSIIRKHTIKVIAYDDTDKKAEASIEVIALYL